MSPVLGAIEAPRPGASGGSIWTKMKRMRFHLGPNTPGVWGQSPRTLALVAPASARLAEEGAVFGHEVAQEA